METDLIEWDRLKHFSATLERLIPTMTDVLKAKGFKHTEGFHVPCYLNYMPKEEAANFPLPE
jgi:hypothetical protein